MGQSRPEAAAERPKAVTDRLELSLGQSATLREKLEQLDRHVILRNLPDVPASKRLLRPAMLEALLEFLPTTKSEFLERIPRYLREATNPQEGEYLPQILEIIQEDEAAELE
jgi:hypothetical protein